jgi:hypothetical protein
MHRASVVRHLATLLHIFEDMQYCGRPQLCDDGTSDRADRRIAAVEYAPAPFRPRSAPAGMRWPRRDQMILQSPQGVRKKSANSQREPTPTNGIRAGQTRCKGKTRRSQNCRSSRSACSRKTAPRPLTCGYLFSSTRVAAGHLPPPPQPGRARPPARGQSAGWFPGPGSRRPAGRQGWRSSRCLRPR